RSGKVDISPQIIKLMLRSADILADLVRFSRDGGDMDHARVAQMPEGLTRAGGLTPEPAPVEAPVAFAAAPGEPDEFGFAPTPVTFDFGSDAQAEPAVDEFGFAPVMIDFDEVLAADAAIPHVVDITFRPKPELYAKANDALRLLRELGRLGT